MVSTLSNGYKLPATGDKGDVFYPALEDNITRLNAHNHDGNNSELIVTSAFTKGTTAVTNTGWSAAGDTFRKSVAMPTNYTFEKGQLEFRLNGGTLATEIVNPRIEKIDSSNFYLYSPVSNQAFDLTVT